MITVDKNKLLVERLCHHIAPLMKEIVLVGGCAVGYLITDKTQLQPRETDDVDLAVEITTYPQYRDFGKKLKKLGFVEDTEVTCRWRKEELKLDVMPLAGNVLGFTNPWYSHAVRTAATVRLENGMSLRHIDAPTFIATKIESFRSRGGGDFTHHDIEDILTIVNGREELEQEIKLAEPDLREHVQDELSNYLGLPPFTDMIPGHLRPYEGRQELVIERLRKIVGD